MTQPFADYFPKGISLYVPNCEYAIDSDINNREHVAEFLNVLALDADGILDGVQMVNGSAVTVTSFTSGAASATEIAYYGMVPFSSTSVFKGWGRNVTVIASGANTRVMTVTGYDYLGQKMVENITLNGNNTVQGLKAFAWILSVSFSSDTDTTTVDVGWGNKLGLPFAGEAMVVEIKNGAVAANAGTFVAALADATTPTATNADTRGTYLPATVLPDGSNDFKILYMKRSGNLHGNAQFSG